MESIKESDETQLKCKPTKENEKDMHSSTNKFVGASSGLKIPEDKQYNKWDILEISERLHSTPRKGGWVGRNFVLLFLYQEKMGGWVFFIVIFIIGLD